MVPGSHPQEEWRPVPGFEGLYEVSSFGSVRSLRFDPPRHIRKGHDKDGYPIVWLYRGGKRSGRALHRLVCLVFNGEQPDALRKEVAHLDGTRTNARADNLKWCGKVENHFHKRAHGTHQAGEKCPRSRLTEAQVREIKGRLLRGRCNLSAMDREYGVGPGTVREIALGRNWRHVIVTNDPIARGSVRALNGD